MNDFYFLREELQERNSLIRTLSKRNDHMEKCRKIDMKKNRHDQIYQFHWKVILAKFPHQKASLSLFVIWQTLLVEGIIRKTQIWPDQI